ncbi:hypothetical protein L596_023631 [Steinernema carpocapsae]|uniref:Saposin B-type domain-containing protein n=1 Tax=Steinernema carpocapsae TaxID=34508 RepID=A0A4U5MEG1_STECR|nr:hypothetical protein L596_023631 [Steinernema carpocapsae]
MRLSLLLAIFAVLFCFSAALVIPKEKQPIDLHHHKLKCKACHELYKFLKEAENLSGDALKIYLDKKCGFIPFISDECRHLVGKAVDHIEKYGRKFDENNLCTHVLHAC